MIVDNTWGGGGGVGMTMTTTIDYHAPFDRGLKEQYPGFTMILRSSKTHLHFT